MAVSESEDKPNDRGSLNGSEHDVGTSQKLPDEESGGSNPESEPPNVAHGEQDSNIVHQSKGKLIIILFALGLATFLSALDATIITTALPTITEHFDSAAGYTWIGSAFLVANAASIPTWGKVSDIFGRKPILLIANIVFMVGSLVAGLSTSITMLITARAVQGVRAGGLQNLVNVVIGDLFSIRRRGAFYGMIGAVWAFACAIGPILGGVFTERASWRWCFYVNLPLDGVAFILLLVFLKLKTPRTPILEGLKAIDWVGSLLVVGGTPMLLLGLQFGGSSFSWRSATVICMIIFGAVAFVLVGIWETRFAKSPILPPRLFTKLTNKGTLAVVFFHGFAFMGAPYYLPLYFQVIRGASPIDSGIYLLPTAVLLALSSTFAGLFIKKVGVFFPPMYFGMFLVTLGYGLFIDFTSTSSWAKLIIFQIILGLGIGPVFQSPIIALHAHIDPRDVGTGTATIGFIRQLATSASVVIGEVVFQNEVDKKAGALAAILGTKLAEKLGGDDVAASADIIKALPAVQRAMVRRSYAQALQPTWILYTCVGFVGLLCTLLVRPKALETRHMETETGLEADRERNKPS